MSAALGWARERDDSSGRYARLGLVRDQDRLQPRHRRGLGIERDQHHRRRRHDQGGDDYCAHCARKIRAGFGSSHAASSRESPKPFNDSSLNGAKFPA